MDGSGKKRGDRQQSTEARETEKRRDEREVEAEEEKRSQKILGKPIVLVK